MTGRWIRFNFGIIGLPIRGEERCFKSGEVAYIPASALALVEGRRNTVNGELLITLLTEREGEQSFRAQCEDLPGEYVDEWAERLYRAQYDPPGAAAMTAFDRVAANAAETSSILDRPRFQRKRSAS